MASTTSEQLPVRTSFCSTPTWRDFFPTRRVSTKRFAGPRALQRRRPPRLRGSARRSNPRLERTGGETARHGRVHVGRRPLNRRPLDGVERTL